MARFLLDMLALGRQWLVQCPSTALVLSLWAVGMATLLLSGTRLW